MSLRRCAVIPLLLLTLTPLYAASPATAPAPSADPAALLQAALTAMKSPPTTGVLIAQLGPLSIAAKAGARPGDIITAYDGHDIRTEDALDEAIHRAVIEGESPVELCLRRGPDKLALTVPRGPLGVTAREVDVGVPLPLNPPETPRGELTLEWDKVPTLAPAPGQLQTAPAFFRLESHANLAGFDALRLARHGEKWELALTEYTPANDRFAPTEVLVVTFRPGDQQQAAAFDLESLVLLSGRALVQAERKGAFLKGTLGPPPTATAPAGPTTRPVEAPPQLAIQPPATAPTAPFSIQTSEFRIPTSLNALPSFALPALAAALPQRRDLVLNVALISEIDLQTRPGYCLRTLGEQKVNLATGPATLFAVELLHFGRRDTVWYFDQARELRQIDFGHDLLAHRISPQSAEPAFHPDTQPPATFPTPRR